MHAFWDKDEYLNLCGQKVEVQGHSMTKSSAGGGIQSST